MNVTKTVSAAALALGLSLSGLAGTANAASDLANDLPRAHLDKGGQHGCGAGKCGSKGEEDKDKQEDKEGQDKGDDKKCGAGKCGEGSCG